MSKGRLEAFSDGVVAILITIMVLELHAPEKPDGGDLQALVPLGPIFLSYVLSFINLGIYWNNHHHLLQASKVVDGRVLWANLHLLFWLSLIPFGTAWMGQNDFAALPTAGYGAILLMSGVAFYVLVRMLVGAEGQPPALATAIGSDRKGIVSVLIYTAAVAIALVWPWVAFGLYILVAGMWFIPDRRMERALER